MRSNGSDESDPVMRGGPVGGRTHIPPPVPSAPSLPGSSSVRFDEQQPQGGYLAQQQTYKQTGPIRVPVPSTNAESSLRAVNTNTPSRANPSRGMSTHSSPTPGLDDSPYIRFAIDQLTRDEELMGQGRYGSVISAADDRRPYQMPAAEASARHQTQGQARSDRDRAVSAAIPVAAAGAELAEADEILKPHNRRYSPIAEEDPDYISSPTRHESQQYSHLRTQPLSPTSPQQDHPLLDYEDTTAGEEVFIAAEAPENDHLHPALTFLPLILRIPSLLLVLALVLGALALIVVAVVSSTKNGGLTLYDGVGTSTYFLFEYLPQMLGLGLLLVLFSVQAAIYRIAPYSNMASSRPSAVLQHLSTLPRNFVTPDLSFFKHGEPIIGVVMVIFWIVAVFSVPLLACLFQTQLFDNQWRWAPAQAIAWILVVLYALTATAVSLVLLRFATGPSGLRWDPSSLADLIPLFQRSNLLKDFDELETALSIRAQFTDRPLRLGYWKTSRNNELFYGVGEEGAPVRLLSPRQSRLKEKMTGYRNKNPQGVYDLEGQAQMTTNNNTVESFQRNIHSPFLRYRWTRWFLRDTFVIAWITIAMVLLIAFLVVSYVHGAVINGFKPLLPSHTNTSGFSAANFMYSFLPAFLGQMLFLLWQPIDTYMRAIQPFANLSSPMGTTAQKSLLVSYNASLLLTPLTSLLNGDYRVTITSTVTLLALPIPLLAGGTFTARYFSSSSTVLIAAEPASFHALTFFLVVYALAYLAIFPTRIRYLPHGIDTIAEKVSWIYASPLALLDPIVREPGYKTDLVTRLLVLPPGEGVASPTHALTTATNPTTESSARDSGVSGMEQQGLMSEKASWGEQQNRSSVYANCRDSTVSTSSASSPSGHMPWRSRFSTFNSEDDTEAAKKKAKEEVGPRYAFGVYRGVDGKEHLGIERLERRGGGGVLVTTGGRGRV